LEPFFKIFNSKKAILSFTVIVLFLFSTSTGQTNITPEYKVKSVFIFNFTRFVDWPETYMKNNSDPFIIGIIGENPFGNILEETVLGEKVGTHPIVVQHFTDKNAVANCQLLYIGYSDERRIREVITNLNKRPVLTVSDANNFCLMGGIVQFYQEENKIRLMINTQNSKAAALNISSKLLAVARVL
jgi:hypothetical protein